MFNMIISMLTAIGKINFNPQGFVDMLPKLGEGLLCIFIVIGIIILLTMLLNKITSKNKDK